MSENTFDHAAFRTFELAGWAAKADPYHRFFGPLAARVVEPLLDLARIAPGAAVLDVASGPGYLAAGAAARGAAVIGTDLAPEMVALASQLNPDVSFQVADAAELPFADGTFDAVVGNLVLPHLEAPRRAAAEWVRVLKPGGRLVQGMWGPPSENRLAGIPYDAVAAAGQLRSVDIPPGPPFFGFASDAALSELFSGAGLADIAVEPLRFDQLLSDPDAYWDDFLSGTIRSSAVITHQPPEIQQRIRAAFDRLVQPYTTADGLRLPVVILLATGVKRAA
jgi:SAM-dependent methyltransferase